MSSSYNVRSAEMIAIHYWRRERDTTTNRNHFAASPMLPIAFGIFLSPVANCSRSAALK